MIPTGIKTVPGPQPVHYTLWPSEPYYWRR